MTVLNTAQWKYSLLVLSPQRHFCLLCMEDAWEMKCSDGRYGRKRIRWQESRQYSTAPSTIGDLENFSTKSSHQFIVLWNVIITLKDTIFPPSSFSSHAGEVVKYRWPTSTQNDLLRHRSVLIRMLRRYWRRLTSTHRTGFKFTRCCVQSAKLVVRMRDLKAIYTSPHPHMHPYLAGGPAWVLRTRTERSRRARGMSVARDWSASKGEDSSSRQRATPTIGESGRDRNWAWGRVVAVTDWRRFLKCLKVVVGRDLNAMDHDNIPQYLVLYVMFLPKDFLDVLKVVWRPMRNCTRSL